MNRNVGIGVIVILILALGAWWFWGSSSMNSSDTSNTASSTDVTTGTNGTNGQTQTTSGTGTFRTLVTQGGNYTCTVMTTPTESSRTTGTIYSAGGKTRLDLKITTNGTDVTMHTIRSGGTAYTWVDGQTKGTKSTITASSAIVPQPTGATISDDSEISSDCHPWSPVASQFVVPAGITF
ncbi:MAG TPA: hypothetical protein VHD31_03105 [Candidatus Paceibacterota bacterium]|nr:hypothetical protein [Candidatus Paceibacterota bacterium]